MNLELKSLCYKEKGLINYTMKKMNVWTAGKPHSSHGQPFGRAAVVRTHSSLTDAVNNRECSVAHSVNPPGTWTGINKFVFSSLFLFFDVLNFVKNRPPPNKYQNIRLK